MMISAAQAQKIAGMSASRIPQSGTCAQSAVSLSTSFLQLTRRRGPRWSSGFEIGRGGESISWAINCKQAPSSFFVSSAGDASDDAVVAKNTAIAVRDWTGTTKIAELVLPTALDLASAVACDQQLPPLLSMIIDGLPPMQQSEFRHEAEKRLRQYVERYPSAQASLPHYFRVALSIASHVHHNVVSLDRLVAISINYGLQYVLDDLFFDHPDHESLQAQYGVTCNARESSHKTQEYLDHLDAVFSQKVQPRSPAPLIETLLREAGRELLELSNPEWFQNYIADVERSHRTNVDSLADIVQGPNSRFKDLESYVAMRAENSGGKYILTMIEFANNTYIPNTWRATPYFEKLTMATTLHLGFENDIFSYHRESALEHNPRNVISVLMDCEGMSFLQAVHVAIGLVNACAGAIMDMEDKAWNPTLRNHLQDVLALIAGGVYFSYKSERYRHPDSVFPELRDVTYN